MTRADVIARAWDELGHVADGMWSTQPPLPPGTVIDLQPGARIVWFPPDAAAPWPRRRAWTV